MGASDFRDSKLFDNLVELITYIFSSKNIVGEKIQRDDFGGYVFFLFNLEEALKENPLYIKIKEYMENDDIVSRHVNVLVGLSDRGQRQTVWTYISFLIREQLYHNDGMMLLDMDKFIEDYKILEKFFYSDIIKMRACLRLINFNMTDEEIILNKELKIKTIEEHDKRMFMSSRFMNPYTQFIIEYTYDDFKVFDGVDKDNAQSYIKQFQDIQTILYQVVDVLRLYKKGDLITGELYKTALHPVIEMGSSSIPSFNAEIFRLNFYELSSDDKGPFIQLWKKMVKHVLPQYKEFKISLRRLGLAIERHRYDDRLVDLVIAFESLLFKSGETTELMYRLKVRLSKILKKEYKERIQIKTDMTEIYKLRNRIVHGEDYNIDRELIKKCENYLRQALTIYLEYRQKKSHEELLDHLDFTELWDYAVNSLMK